MLYKIDFGVFKFKSPLLKSKLNLLNKMISLDFFYIHINHLSQISLIKMTLKWRYIYLFEIIDNFSIVEHGFGSFDNDYTLVTTKAS